MSYHNRWYNCQIIYIPSPSKIILRIRSSDVFFDTKSLYVIVGEHYEFKPGKFIPLYLGKYADNDPEKIIKETLYQSTFNMLLNAKKHNQKFEGKVLYAVSGGYVINVQDQIDVFLPFSQMKVGELNIGAVYSFGVRSINLKNSIIICHYSVNIDDIINQYNIGDPVQYRAKNFVPTMGLFVALNNFDCLLPSDILDENFEIPTYGSLHNGFIAYIDTERKKIFISPYRPRVHAIGDVLAARVKRFRANGTAIMVSSNHDVISVSYHELSWGRYTPQVGTIARVKIIGQKQYYSGSIKALMLNIFAPETKYDSVITAKLLHAAKTMVLVYGCVALLKAAPYQNLPPACFYQAIKDKIATAEFIDVQIAKIDCESKSLIVFAVYPNDFRLPDLSAIDFSTKETQYMAGEWTIHVSSNNGSSYQIISVDPWNKCIIGKLSYREKQTEVEYI
jgi:hypothetical protein